METERVRDLMSIGVQTLGRNDELSLADDAMARARIRHLPVLNEDGDLVGIVSQRDLFHSALVKALGYGAVAKQKIMRTIRVKEVMITDVITTTPETPLSEAAQAMVTRKIGCLPVLQGTKLVGILTESDFVRCFGKRKT